MECELVRIGVTCCRAIIGIILNEIITGFLISSTRPLTTKLAPKINVQGSSTTQQRYPRSSIPYWSVFSPSLSLLSPTFYIMSISAVHSRICPQHGRELSNSQWSTLKFIEISHHGYLLFRCWVSRNAFNWSMCNTLSQTFSLVATRFAELTDNNPDCNTSSTYFQARLTVEAVLTSQTCAATTPRRRDAYNFKEGNKWSLIYPQSKSSTHPQKPTEIRSNNYKNTINFLKLLFSFWKQIRNWNCFPFLKNFKILEIVALGLHGCIVSRYPGNPLRSSDVSPFGEIICRCRRSGGDDDNFAILLLVEFWLRHSAHVHVTIRSILFILDSVILLHFFISH